MLRIIKGSILDSECSHIAHQANCVSIRAAGLARAIFEAFPWANVYSSRRARGDDASLLGSITIQGDAGKAERQVINIYGQINPGGPTRGSDSAHSRLEAFSKALNQIAMLPELKSIGFPYGIGCGLARGDWNGYEPLLEGFAEHLAARDVPVILYRLL